MLGHGACSGRWLSECEQEGGTDSRIGFDPDAATHALDHAFADRQANATARVLLACVQPLKDLKNPLQRRGRYADALVTHRDDPFVAYRLAPNLHQGCRHTS